MPSPRFSAENQPKRRGRKVGSRDKLARVVKDKGEELLAKVFHNALHEDCLQSQLALLKYCLPTLKAKQSLVKFPIPDNGSLTDKAEAVIQAAADEMIPPEVANQMLQSLASVAKIKEMEEMQQRIEELERTVLHRHKYFDGRLADAQIAD